MNLKGRLITFDNPLIMGILNITPDSFYDGGKHDNLEMILKSATKMIQDGADILDLGAYSSRPGANHVSEEEEWKRLELPLNLIREKFPNTIISIDTFRSSIASNTLAKGADIINDISGGHLDEKMYAVVGDYQCPYIAMHMNGTPQNMQSKTNYNDFLVDIVSYFEDIKEKSAVHNIKDLIIDPGFGFSKTLEQNFYLLKKLSSLQILDLPYLVGISRKSMIYKTLNCDPAHALNGTTALHMTALQSGASILRVHDVKEAKETVTLFNSIHDAAI